VSDSLPKPDFAKATTEKLKELQEFASQAVKVIWKSLARFFNFLHAHTLAHPKVRRLAALGSAGATYLVGVALAQWDEYALALGCFIIGSSILLLKSYNWEGVNEKPKLSKFLKVLFVAGSLIMLVGSYPVALAKKGNKPWSDTIYRWTYIASLTPDDLARVLRLPTPPEDSEEVNTHRVAQILRNPRPIVPTIVVKQIELPSAIEAGKDTSLKIDLKVKADTAFEVLEYRLTAVEPFYQDAAQQEQQEDDLWNMLMSHSKEGTSLQVPANNESVAIPSQPLLLNSDNVGGLKSGTSHLYYIYYVTDLRGRPLIEFCGHISGDLVFAYCRHHNGP